MKPARDPLIGVPVFGSYRVTGPIGVGGMGAVYLAESAELGKKLAVKVLLPGRSENRQAVARFLAEAKAASAINHRNIIDIIDSAKLQDGRHYILMEYLEGQTLRKFARSHGPLTLEAVLAILGQVCSGLQAAHDRGIIHRDLKPSNIFISPQPDNPYFTKILDFGIAKLEAPDLTSDAKTKSRTVAGTPHYMSPEQARALRDVTHLTDIYSTGVIAYELVTGKPPYMANSAGDLVYQQQTTVPKPPIDLCPGLPPAWNDLIMSAIHLEAGRRPQSAKQLAERMIQGTEDGIRIARAAAPLLFPSSLSEPVTGDSKPPVDDWSKESMPSRPGRPAPTTTAPPESNDIVRTVSHKKGGAQGSQPAASPGTVSVPPGTVSVPPGTASVPPGTAAQPSFTSSQGLLSQQPALYSAASLPVRSPTMSVAPGADTTLGLSASEVPVIEGMAMVRDYGARRTRGLAIAIVAASVIGLAAFVVVPKIGALRSGSQPPLPTEPTIQTLGADEADVTPLGTATGLNAAPNASVDAGSVATAADAGIAPDPRGGEEVADHNTAAESRTKDRRRGKKKRRAKDKRRTTDSADEEPDETVPVNDDDLFKERK